MHRGEAGFGAEADQHEYKRERHQVVVELRRHRQQPRPVETRQHFAAGFANRGRVGEDGAEQRQHQAQPAEHDVFPRRFQRGLAIVEGHEQHRRKRGGFHSDPHHAEVVDQHDEQHPSGEERREHVKLPEAFLGHGGVGEVSTEVTHCVERGRQRHD